MSTEHTPAALQMHRSLDRTGQGLGAPAALAVLPRSGLGEAWGLRQRRWLGLLTRETLQTCATPEGKGSPAGRKGQCEKPQTVGTLTLLLGVHSDIFEGKGIHM